MGLLYRQAVLEEPLAGGNMSRVVRVADTVRRTAGPWTATTQRLLAHVRACGLAWVPEPRGLDEQGREVLSFIEGDVPHAMPAWVWSLPVLTDVARALRAWHDATASFDRTGAVWQSEPREPSEVVCHWDFAPYNCVFREGRFAGAFDFDLCAPGPRLWDLAYTAYRFVPLMPPADDPDAGPGERSPFAWAAGLARLDAFLAAYSGGAEPFYSRQVLVRASADRLGAIAAWTDAFVEKTGETTLAGNAAMYRNHAGWLLRNVG
jgi:hypothetical protein